MSQFSTDIRHVKGSDNTVANTLSRLETINAPSSIDYEQLSHVQLKDNELLSYINSNTTSLRLEHREMSTTNTKIYCDISTGIPRPYLTENFRQKVFDNLHGLSHPSIRATVNSIRKRFVWPNINKDCVNWSRSCIQCQKSKIQRYTVSTIGKF